MATLPQTRGKHLGITRRFLFFFFGVDQLENRAAEWKLARTYSRSELSKEHSQVEGIQTCWDPRMEIKTGLGIKPGWGGQMFSRLLTMADAESTTAIHQNVTDTRSFIHRHYSCRCGSECLQSVPQKPPSLTCTLICEHLQFWLTLKKSYYRLIISN